jgi:hypothetical protein
VSVKATFKGAFPEVGEAEKATTGFDLLALLSLLYNWSLLPYCCLQYCLL